MSADDTVFFLLQAAAQATSSIRDVALKYGYTNGKWLVFRAPTSGLDS
jgi:hypothetical protein